MAAGQALPVVEVVWSHEGEAGASDGHTKEGMGEKGGPLLDEEERERVCAVLEFVVTALHDDLLLELLEGFHGEA